MTRDRRARLHDARLYLIVSPETLGDDWEERVARALASGAVDVLQLRVKAWEDERLRRVAVALRTACQRLDTLFVLNDRVDLALEVEADGVHVGEHDHSVAEARQGIGHDRLVGSSTHDAGELRTAEGDYVGLGPCFATDSKRLTRAPGGAALLEAALPAAPDGLPVFPIGGIDEQNLPSLIAAGATRAAVGAGVLAQSDPARAARALQALLQSATDTRSASGSAPR